MNAGCFSKNTLSTGDLNRPRSPEVRKPLACFLVLFARRKKNKTVLPCRELRGSANLEVAAHSRQLCAIQLNPLPPKAAIWRQSRLFGCLRQRIIAAYGGKKHGVPPSRTARRAPHSTSCKAAYPSSPVRTLTTFSTLYTKILPSPI